jgi:predicted nucleic acid-binding protein
MNRLFCDTLYFAALVNPRDQWHQAAVEIEPLVESVDLVKTEEVLTEFLNFYCEFGSRMRFEVSGYVRQLLLNPKFEIVGRNEMSFINALELYESRLDKGYSLTDCISMNVCRELSITEVLTHDHHFEQEGFTILL